MAMDIKRRLYSLLLAIFLVVLAGSIGYYLLLGGQPTFLDCLYMTVVSLTTVGYGEIVQVTGNVPAEIFTMVLITFGMGVILYGISTLTALIIEGELSGMLRKKKMEKRIAKLDGHYIVCGGGETGRPTLTELSKNQERVVLIEQSAENIARCGTIDDLLYICGDATDDANLVVAGIAKAAGVIVSLPSDKDNLYVTMSARMLNPAVRIITRMTDRKLEAKLRKAGADAVVSPNTIGALRMASEMLRPTVVDFLDSMLRSSQGNLRIHEFTVRAASPLAGCEIRHSGLKDTYNLLVLGARRPDEDIRFNPPASEILSAGTTLVIMGDMGDIVRARSCF